MTVSSDSAELELHVEGVGLLGVDGLVPVGMVIVELERHPGAFTGGALPPCQRVAGVKVGVVEVVVREGRARRESRHLLVRVTPLRIALHPEGIPVRGFPVQAEAAPDRAPIVLCRFSGGGEKAVTLDRY